MASGPLGPAKRAKIITLAAQARLPAVYGVRLFAEGGGLVSFSVDERDLFRRADGYIDKILRGTDPVNLPVEPPTKFDLVINRKAARARTATSSGRRLWSKSRPPHLDPGRTASGETGH